MKIVFQITRRLYDFSVSGLFYVEGEPVPICFQVGPQMISMGLFDTVVANLEKIGRVELLS